MTEPNANNDGLQTSDLPAAGEAKNILDKREIERLLDLTESVETFSKAIDYLSLPQEVTGFELPKTTTLDDVKRVNSQLTEKLGTLISGLTPEQNNHYILLNGVRTRTEEEASNKFAEFIQEHIGANWLQTNDDRYSWKKAHPIPLSGNPDLQKYHQEAITPEEILERSKLGDDGQNILFAENNMSKPLFNQPMGLAGSMEGLGIDPISEESKEDLSRIHSVLLEQENILIGKMRRSPDNSKKFMGSDEVKWEFRRQTNSTFYNEFEKKMGVPYFEPRPEKPEKEEAPSTPKETRSLFTRDCGNCGNTFKSTHPEGSCYDCTLEKITHGMPPEEGDFNSASIIAGTLSPEEERNLLEDLASVEVS